MKKMLIGSIVGGLILLIWQFLSWSLLNVHAAETQYTEKQDQILEALVDLDEGTYFLPNAPTGTPQDEHQKIMESNLGKPWATVSYHKELKMNMGMNMTRAFVINALSVLLLCWILLKFADLNFSSALITSLAVGAIGYFTITYLNSIWFEKSTFGYIVDTAVQWGLVGCWLGWYLPRK